jgi:hypothetical protein
MSSYLTAPHCAPSDFHIFVVPPFHSFASRRTKASADLASGYAKIKDVDSIPKKAAEIATALGGDGAPPPSLSTEVQTAVQVRLGRRPSSFELARHASGLYKRIRRSWPSFEAFCDDIGIEPPRRLATPSKLGRASQE